MAVHKTKTLALSFGEKHRAYINRCRDATFNFAEGAVRAGKTVDNVFAFADALECSPDRIHLATGSTQPNAKLNIGECNGLGLEYLFRGRCRWGKFKGNECLFVDTKTGPKVVVFSGGAKADSFKKIRGNSYGLWIATEINLHHDSTIKEAFNRQLAAKKRKIFWDLNPDSPQSPIYTQYIDNYVEKSAAGTLLGGVNYEHFTIFDNTNISEEAKRQFISQYDPSSIWYKRDILGQRCRAEGVIYTLFANDPKAFILDDIDPEEICFATIGVDFGGNKSAHAFVCTGFTRDMQQVVTLDEFYLKEKISPSRLEEYFVDFVRRCKEKYRVYEAYPDSAETTLIAGLSAAAFRAGLGIDIIPAKKGPINDRIRFYNVLMSHERYKVLRRCENVIAAFSGALWDEKSLTDKRLDDGVQNVDSLDAQEYSTERYMADILDLGAVLCKNS